MANYNKPKWNGLNPGDETRRHGDYIGFAHGETDGTAVDSIQGPTRGQPVAYNQSSDVLEAVTDFTDSGPDVAGVLYTYPVYGDSSNAGPYIDGDVDATVKTSGSVIADLSALGVTAADEGTAVGTNSEIYIIEVFDPDNDLAEVRLR